jgi:CPA2 family monovalent cation:H+ antiporter-2
MSQRQGHIIVVGYGLPGRAVIARARLRGLPCVVIERNPETVARCGKSVEHMIAGDARQTDVLRSAGVEHAATLVLTIPDDEATLAIIELARSLAPDLHIVARCTYTSASLKAMRFGAEVVVAEQVVAAEMDDFMDAYFNRTA